MVSMQSSRSSQHLRDTKQNTSFEASIIVPDQQLLHPTNGDCIRDKQRDKQSENKNSTRCRLGLDHRQMQTPRTDLTAMQKHLPTCQLYESARAPS